jgi:hypothetical protein
MTGSKRHRPVSIPMATDTSASITDRIQTAGATTRHLRSGIFHRGSCVVCWLVAGSALILFAPAGSHILDPRVLPWLAGCTGVLLTLGLVPVGLTALGKAALLRTIEKFRLRRELKPLPRDQQAAALYPLANARCGDTRKLARALVRDLNLRFPEVIPAEATRAGQHEPAPADVLG